MLLIGKQGCPRCKKLRALFSSVPYIEIPKTHVGLGDTLCAITCFFGLTPCSACRIRQNRCNTWFPYFWKVKCIDPKILEVKRKVYKLGVREFPVFVDDDFTKILSPTEVAKSAI